MKPRRLLFRAGCLLGAALLALQFVRPEGNLARSGPGPDDLRTLYPPPAGIRRQLETACYDCHSDHTRYPWYAAVQPLGWWLDRHVQAGRRELNFARFGRYSQKSRVGRLEDIIDAVGDGSMPLASYTWIHRDAVLTKAERDELVAWAEDLAGRIEDGP